MIFQKSHLKSGKRLLTSGMESQARTKDGRLLSNLVLLGMAVAFLGCSKSNSTPHDSEHDSNNAAVSIDFAASIDSSKSLRARLLAAKNLTEHERKQLQQLLLNRLPGDWDQATLDDIGVLARIGDKKCLPKLEAMYNTKDVVSGKILANIEYAIADIKQRNR